MNKVLIISFDVPFDNVGHAGGKTHNFYLKKISQDERFDTFLISFCIPRDLPKLDLDKYGIKNKVFVIRPEKKYKAVRGFINLSSRFNPWDKFAGMTPHYYEKKVLGQLKMMKADNYHPDIIILEWTSMVLLAPDIKEIFPDARIIASEHDVSFLGYKRKYEFEKNIIKKAIARIRYKTMHTKELEAIAKCDYVFPHNHKDGRLLLSESVSKTKIHPIVPFYMDFTDIQWNGNSKNIVFFGAMSRPENSLSAIWFIENVMPGLQDTGVVFQVIGGGPGEDLKKYESDNVKILGFVDDVAPYFADACCMVAPLVLGAGIKVKVLEGMSSGVPVITNRIGIEGIYAADKKEYLHSETPKEYVNNIEFLLNNHEEAEKISANAKKFIHERFDMEKSAQDYLNKIQR